jgi:hypothetical protein
MMGLAASFTPISSGNCLVIFTGLATNSVAGDGVQIQARYGTGPAPVNGAGATGSMTGAQLTFVGSTPAGAQGWTIASIVTGLAIGTPYWLDVSIAQVTGGSTNVSALQVVAVEL